MIKLSFAVLVSFLASVGISRAERPNVIVIVTDDQGYGDMSCHGNPWLKTPNLDRLAAEGVRFDDYHVDPYCTPTRAALMTGRHSTRTGAWTVTKGRQLMYADEVTMADCFSESGYRTGMFGKWHLGDPYPYAPRNRGFHEVVCHRAGGVDEIGNPDGNNYFDDTYYRNGRPEKFEGYCTDVFFSEALRFIDDKNERPFFIYLPLNAMHSPFTAPEKYWKRFEAMGMADKRAKFFGMIENFDDNLERLMGALESRSLDENTLIIFMGDNGTAQGSDGERDGFNVGMRGKKGSVYEGGHRVACFARWKGNFEANLRVDQLAAHRDWFPTLVELCGLGYEDKSRFDGMSLAPLLKGESSGWSERILFVDQQMSNIVPAKLNSKGRLGYAVLSEKWRMVNGELYDIKKDPGQRTDLAKDHPQLVQEFHASYLKHIADVSKHGNAFSYFQLGLDEENPVHITSRDWFPTVGGVIWEKSQLADDQLFINGTWPVKVTEAGRYVIRLSRFPQDASAPMKANQARLKLGGIARVLELEPSDQSATFEVTLEAGEAILETSLRDAASGRTRGAYFVSAERLD